MKKDILDYTEIELCKYFKTNKKNKIEREKILKEYYDKRYEEVIRKSKLLPPADYYSIEEDLKNTKFTKYEDLTQEEKDFLEQFRK